MNKAWLSFHGDALLSSAFKHGGHGWIDPYEKRVLHLQGSPWQRRSLVFLKKISLYEAMWLYLPQNILFLLVISIQQLFGIGIEFVYVLVLDTTSFFPNK